MERQCLVEYSTFGNFDKKIWFSEIWEIKTLSENNDKQNYSQKNKTFKVNHNDDGWEIDDTISQNKPNLSKNKISNYSEDENSITYDFPTGKVFKTQKSKKIYGPPGTGKTTVLIEIVKKAINDGISPEDIAFIAFTNKAANVAKDRVSIAFPDLGFIAFPNFSTIHAFATKIGGTGGSKLMQQGDFKEFDKNIVCWTEWTSLGDATSATARYSHPVLDAYSLSIAHQEKMNYDNFCENLIFKSEVKQDKRDLNNTIDALANYFPNFPKNNEERKANLSFFTEQYIQKFLSFKNKNYLISFDDVITRVANQNFPEDRIPTFDVLIVDEAQDLSKHQWKFINKLIKKAKDTYIAGDDDQAIMVNVGSNPEAFVDMETSEEPLVLKQSHRVPKINHQYVEIGVMKKIIEDFAIRVKKNWEPKNEKGSLGNPTKLKPEYSKTSDKYIITKTIETCETEIDIETLLDKVEADWGKFNQQNSELEISNIKELIDNSEKIQFKKIALDTIEKKLNKAFEIRGNQFFLEKSLQNTIKDQLKNNCLDHKNLILLDNMGIFNDEIIISNVIYPKEEKGPPSWLIMSPSKQTGEDISDALREMRIPHFYGNKPKGESKKENTLIRVQTIHISKGAEADNTAIVVGSKGDVISLSENPRLAYVALTRAKKRMFPRVIKNNLFKPKEQITWKKFLKAVEDYNAMFPSKFQI